MKKDPIQSAFEEGWGKIDTAAEPVTTGVVRHNDSSQEIREIRQEELLTND